MTEREFIDKTRKANGPRVRYFQNNYDARTYFREYRKHDKELTETEFSRILRACFLKIVEYLTSGKDVTLPLKMGKLQTLRHEKKVFIKDGKIRTNLGIDWKETLKLWYADANCMKKKQLVWHDTDNVFLVYYNKSCARYKNKGFMVFKSSRILKHAIRDAVKENKLSSFNIIWKTDLR